MNQFQFLNHKEFYYEIIQVMKDQFYQINFVVHLLKNIIEVQLIHLIIFDYRNIWFWFVIFLLMILHLNLSEVLHNDDYLQNHRHCIHHYHINQLHRVHENKEFDFHHWNEKKERLIDRCLGVFNCFCMSDIVIKFFYEVLRDRFEFLNFFETGHLKERKNTPSFGYLAV